MNALCRMLSVVAIFVMVGCGGSSLYVDYDREALWSNYRTYDWLPEPRAAAIGPLAENPKHRTWIESTVDLEMKRAGLRRETENPELVVAYYAGLRGPLDPASWGYEYGSERAYAQGGLDLATYEDNTIVLDFVDAASKKLIWRGALGGVVNSPGKAEQSIREITKKIVSEYPPR